MLGAERAPLLLTTSIVAVHNLLNMILPVRTGEISYVMLAQKRLNARLSEGAATLVLARLYDMVGIAAFFLVGFFAIRTGEGSTGRYAIAAVILFAVSLVALLLLGPIVDRLRRFLDARKTLPGSRLEKLKRLLASLSTAITDAKARGEFLRIFAVTEMQWFFTFLTCFSILRACPGAHDFPFLASIVGSTGLSLALILPINPIGNVGTFEAGWVLGYMLAGLPRETATASAIVAHAAILFYAGFLALFGYLHLRATAKDEGTR